MYQPKLITLIEVIATVTASSLRVIRVMKIIVLMSVGFVSELAMKLSALYIMLHDF